MKRKLKEEYGWRTWAGRWLLVIMGGMVALFHVLMAVTTPDQLAARNPERFPETVGSQVILPVTALWLVTEGEEVSFYLAMVNRSDDGETNMDSAIVGIVASKEDTRVAEILAMSPDDLVVSPALLVGKRDRRPRSQELLTTIAETNGLPLSWSERIWTDYLVNRANYVAEHQRMTMIYWGLWAGLGLTVVWLVVHWILRRRFYQSLYAQLPELKENLSLLQTVSDYADVRRGLYLYQGYVICLGPSPALIEGARLKSLTLYSVETKGRYGVRATAYSLKAAVVAGPAQYFKAFGRKKGLVAAYAAYQDAVVSHFPDVTIIQEEEAMG